MHLAARLGLCFTASLFVYLTAAQGMPGNSGPKACTMEDAQGHRADFHLTVHPQTLLLDLGGGKVYAFPKNHELSDNKMQVGAIGDPQTGNMSILLDDAGKFQMTFMPRGEPVAFVYGECRP